MRTSDHPNGARRWAEEIAERHDELPGTREYWDEDKDEDEDDGAERPAERRPWALTEAEYLDLVERIYDRVMAVLGAEEGEVALDGGGTDLMLYDAISHAERGLRDHWLEMAAEILERHRPRPVVITPCDACDAMVTWAEEDDAERDVVRAWPGRRAEAAPGVLSRAAWGASEAILDDYGDRCYWAAQ